jgi:hypothetical protein
MILLFLGWKWQQEVNEAILSDSQWHVDMTCSVDKDGWMYATDFSSLIDIKSGSSTMGAIHFVRRKCLSRLKVFDGESS